MAVLHMVNDCELNNRLFCFGYLSFLGCLAQKEISHEADDLVFTVI